MCRTAACTCAVTGLSRIDPPITNKQKRQLQELSDQAPRFFFRGWTKSSGGGWQDSTGRGLNNVDEILPHAFHPNSQSQLKKPRNLWEIPHLGSKITGHYLGCTMIESEFSSWSHDLSVSLRFANNKSSASFEPYLSVIDRSLLPSYNMIFHTVDLISIGIPGVDAGGSHEYLLYGPVKGPGLICVKLRDLVCIGFSYSLLAEQAFKRLPPPRQSTEFCQDKNQSAIDFARAFLPECVDKHVPLFYFLAATRRAIDDHSICEPKSSTQLRQWCQILTQAIETEVKKPLPPDFAGEFYNAIPMLSSQPIAERPLVLLRAMVHFAQKRRQDGSGDKILKDFVRLEMMQKSNETEAVENSNQESYETEATKELKKMEAAKRRLCVIL